MRVADLAILIDRWMTRWEDFDGAKPGVAYYIAQQLANEELLAPGVLDASVASRVAAGSFRTEET